MLEDPMGYGDRDKGPDTAILTLLFLLFSLLSVSYTHLTLPTSDLV